MPVPDQRGAVGRRLLRETAYTALCDAIVSGTLQPGEQLHDGEICAWLGLSRTPVREALARLEDEGLVETAPQRFTRVAALERDGVREAFPLLAAVHGLATELAVPRMIPDDIEALEIANADYVHALRAREGAEAHAADERFHDVFVAASGNREIARVLERLVPRVRRLERLCTAVLPGRRSVAQHQAMMERAASGDGAGTATAARANWMTLGALMERGLDEGDA